MLTINENIIKKYKTLFHSVAIFPAWILIIDACLLVIPALLILLSAKSVFGVNTLLTVVALFILGKITIREKKYSYIGWGSLTIALCIVLFIVPNGIHLFYLVTVSALVTASSYFGFAYKQIISNSAYLWNSLFFILFISHALIISAPHTFGLNIQEDKFSSLISESFNKTYTMDPVEFSQTEEGRPFAIEIYDTSLFITKEELETVITSNPQPLINFQQSRLTELQKLNSSSPYIYLINIYLNSLLTN